MRATPSRSRGASETEQASNFLEAHARASPDLPDGAAREPCTGADSEGLEVREEAVHRHRALFKRGNNDGRRATRPPAPLLGEVSTQRSGSRRSARVPRPFPPKILPKVDFEVT